LPDVCGVRIENLCTVVEADGFPGFLEVVPLTFAALDERLIDRALLTSREEAWLEGYLRERVERLGPMPFGAGSMTPPQRRR
jgi:hypothetical protein